MSDPNPLSSPSPTDGCPKCGYRTVETLGGFPHLPAKVRVEKSSPLPTRDADESCARCGLVFALWKPESSPAAVALDSEGETLWRKVEEEWNEAARHDGFVKHCLQHNLLSAAGRLYRARLDKTPGDAIAAKMQAEIVAKASLTMAMAQQRRGPSDPFTRSKWFWTIVLTAMALAIGAAFLWRPKARDVDRPVPAAQYLR